MWPSGQSLSHLTLRSVIIYACVLNEIVNLAGCTMYGGERAGSPNGGLRVQSYRPQYPLVQLYPVSPGRWEKRPFFFINTNDVKKQDDLTTSVTVESKVPSSIERGRDTRVEEIVRTNNCRAMKRLMGRAGNGWACFPLEACKQWHSSLNSTDPFVYANNEVAWPTCQWRKERLDKVHAKDKWTPVSVCCPKPSLNRQESPVRTLTKFFYELPIKKTHVTIVNKRHEVKYNHCGKVQLKTTLRSTRTQEKKHPISSQSFATRFKRLVGGYTTSILRHPWMASLWYRGRFECGAVIIHLKVLLTAAHCLPENFTTSHIQILVGSESLGSGTAYAVSYVVVNRGYKPGFLYDDVAAIVLKERLTLSDSVYPICLPKKGMENPKEGSMATVIGFGTYFHDGPMADSLQEGSVEIRSSKKCSEMYSKLSRKLFTRGIGKSFICAGSTSAVTDTCQGDSGGPLSITMNGHSVLIGIVSFGFKCAEEYPGVYAATSHYSAWIDRVIKDLPRV